MTSTQNRQHVVTLVNEACAEGARLKSACGELGIGTNTYRRWARGGEDQRPVALRAQPAHTLTTMERAMILALCHRPDYASLPPGQIVPRLLDEQNWYLASESSFYRVLRQANEQHRRGPAAAPRSCGPPRRHKAMGPNQTWTWDVTYCQSPIRGLFYYLYFIVDVYSRKIVAAEVFESENTMNSRTVIERAILREGCVNAPPVLHADNGSAMKGSTLQVALEKLGVTPSYSRPRVSNDNAFSESLFGTCKQRPGYPPEGFENLTAAREWVLEFVQWYNHEHRHSAIRFVTPVQRHAGEDTAILAERARLYQDARARNPGRWIGKTRNWEPVGAVWLNPELEGGNEQANEYEEVA